MEKEPDTTPDEFVNVTVRIKPLLTEENSCLQIVNNDPPILLLLDKSQPFHFDQIFTNENNQAEIYNETVKPLVKAVKLGYNCTVFAYGQTGTGKTYTIGTNPLINDVGDNFGIISRTLQDFIEDNDNTNGKFEILISFIEIYNEKVYDLLNEDNINPLPVKGFQACGFKQQQVKDIEQALNYLRKGGEIRHTGKTKQNSNSSRSHAIFTVYCRVYTENHDTARVAKLNLVDLAGSESVRKTGNQGSSFHEGININKGLLCLGQVMAALTTKSNHIPYRQSMITTILQDSLNTKNFVSLIACISSKIEDSGETQQTLEFASRVKRMKNKPEINSFIQQYKKDNPLLFNLNRGPTPVKRTFSGYETPLKRVKKNLPVILEPFREYSCDSLSFSSVSTVQHENNQNFSPIIKKYMSAMENSIVNKLEGIIQTTLTKQRRRSTRLMNKENQESNTPGFNWDKVATIIRKEVLQLTGKHRVTSSPITSPIVGGGENLERLIPKQLTYDENSVVDQCEIVENLNKSADFIFKVPEVQVRRKATPKRKSLRLQLKADEIIVNTSRRKSLRIQNKIDNSCKTCMLHLAAKTPQHKRINNLKVLEKKSSLSPITGRTKQVLTILNEGSIKDISTLHTIGAKTAEKIHFYRELKGKFKAISELAEMPYWSKNKFQKFLKENFLRSE